MRALPLPRALDPPSALLEVCVWDMDQKPCPVCSSPQDLVRHAGLTTPPVVPETLPLGLCTCCFLLSSHGFCPEIDLWRWEEQKNGELCEGRGISEKKSINIERCGQGGVAGLRRSGFGEKGGSRRAFEEQNGASMAVGTQVTWCDCKREVG